ncbi:trans-sialidase, putative, partial [Trypanosoma cruzi marinkellei]
PQRPNMSRHLFYSAVLLLLLVVVMSCVTGEAVVDEVTSPDSGTLMKILFNWRDLKDAETVGLLRAPSLVEMDGEVFALAEAQCTKDTNVFTGIALELLKLTDKQSKELAATEMKTQVLVECPSDKRNCASKNADQAASASEVKVHVSRPTTVVQGSEIYILLGNYSFPVTDPAADVFQWGFLLAMGTVRNNEDSTKMIHWNDTYVLPWISFEEQ